MSTLYDGKPGSITTESPLTITGASNTYPIVITVSGSLPAEFYTSGGLGGSPAAPKVRIYDVQGNTAANGEWVATPTGASTFTIPTAGSGAWTSGGSVQALYLKSLYTVPSDGDNDNAASITPWAVATGDRSQFLAAQVGQFKLARKEVWLYSDLTNAAWCFIAAGGVVANTPIQFVSDGAAWAGVINSVIASPTTGGIAPVFALSGVVAGDFIDVRLDTMFVADGAGGGRLVLYGSVAAPGVTPVWPGGGYAEMLGGSAFGMGPAGTAPPVQVSVHGIINTVPSGNLYIQPIYYPYNTSTQSPQCKGDTLLEVNIWRPTGMPQ